MTLYLLYRQVGASCLAGVALTIVMVPVNMAIAKAIGRKSERMMRAKDQRVKTVSEMLAGARVIKFFAWEGYFSKKIRDGRRDKQFLSCSLFLEGRGG